MSILIRDLTKIELSLGKLLKLLCEFGDDELKESVSGGFVDINAAPIVTAPA